MFAMVSKTAKSEIFARFALTSTTLLFVIMGLEGIGLVPLIDYQRLFQTRATERWLRPGNLFDEELLHRGEPNFGIFGLKRKGNIANHWCLSAAPPECRFNFSLDSKGFRNNIDLIRADIAVIGDSYIEAAGVPLKQSTTSLLAESTQSAVVNLGRSSYGPQQELIVLKRYALPLAPRTVVWAFYEGNDLHDVLRYDHIRVKRARKPQLGPSIWKRSFTALFLDAVLYQFKPCTPKSRPRYGLFPQPINS